MFSGNPNLRGDGESVPMEPWQLQEIKKCVRDPVYFANNYVKITTKDKGVQLFKTWDFQSDLINTMKSNRFVISKFPRQCGKCVYYDMLIYVRMHTGEEIEMKIGEFFDMIKEAQQIKDISCK